MLFVTFINEVCCQFFVSFTSIYLHFPTLHLSVAYYVAFLAFGCTSLCVATNQIVHTEPYSSLHDNKSLHSQQGIKLAKLAHSPRQGASIRVHPTTLGHRSFHLQKLHHVQFKSHHGEASLVTKSKKRDFFKTFPSPNILQGKGWVRTLFFRGFGLQDIYQSVLV